MRIVSFLLPLLSYGTFSAENFQKTWKSTVRKISKYSFFLHFLPLVLLDNIVSYCRSTTRGEVVFFLQKNYIKNDYLHQFDLSLFRPKWPKSCWKFFKIFLRRCKVCAVRSQAEIWRRWEGNQNLGNFSYIIYTYV